MLHSWPYFVKTVVYPFLKYNPHFSDKVVSQAIIERWFKELEDKVSDAPSKFLQRRIRLEVVDTLVVILDQSPYFASKYLAKFLSSWNNTIMGRLKEFSYKEIYD